MSQIHCTRSFCDNNYWHSRNSHGYSLLLYVCHFLALFPSQLLFLDGFFFGLFLFFLLPLLNLLLQSVPNRKTIVMSEVGLPTFFARDSGCALLGAKLPPAVVIYPNGADSPSLFLVTWHPSVPPISTPCPPPYHPTKSFRVFKNCFVLCCFDSCTEWWLLSNCMNKHIDLNGYIPPPWGRISRKQMESGLVV